MTDEEDRDSPETSAERESGVANAHRHPKRWRKGMPSPNAAGRPRNPKNAGQRDRRNARIPEPHGTQSESADYCPRDLCD
jgi:hypothetical protein